LEKGAERAVYACVKELIAGKKIKLLKKRVSVRKISTFKKFCIVFSTFNLPKFPV